MFRVLALDGGGVRGIIPATILAELEERARSPVCELFDLVAATSTGAIIGLGLLRPGVGHKPARTARDIADSYGATSRATFTRSAWSKVTNPKGLLGPMYDEASLQRLLDEEFGQVTLADSLTDVIVPSYDLKARMPYFFKSRDVRLGKQEDQPMACVARATAAAPTYFRPVEIHDKGTERWLVDGGVVANNPAVCGYAEAVNVLRESRDGSSIGVVSVGCGSISVDYATPGTKSGGKLAWAKPMFDIVLDGQEESADFQMRQLLPQSYFRLQIPLPERIGGRPSGVNDIDNASWSNVRTLRQAAEQAIMRHDADLDRIVAGFCTARPEGRV